MTIVFMFPGQSSRSAGMLDKAIGAWPEAAAIVNRASQVLGRDLRAWYAQPADAAYATNRDVQVGVFLASYLYQRALESQGVRATQSLGLSLGEYNHLLHAGAIGFEDALRLVQARGELYDAGPDGMMASVFPLPIDELQPFVDAAGALGVIEIANRNSPTQNVIAGEHAAVESAMAKIDADDIGVQAVVIERRIPMHTSLFRGVGAQLRQRLDTVAWSQPACPYFPNVTAEPMTSPSGRDISSLLEQHAYSPVRWRESIDAIADRDADACFVEVGPGAVLFNLLQKSWRQNKKLRCDDLKDPAGHLAEVVKELRHAA